MDVKFGKIVSNNNLFVASSAAANADGNIFTPGLQSGWDIKKQQKPVVGNRMNDFDSTILEDNAYQMISDEMFKLEHKITRFEDLLSKMTTEIEVLESLGYSIQISDLKERKRKIEQELALANKRYAELGLSAKISGHIASAVSHTSKKKEGVFTKIKYFFSKKILARFSKKFDYSQVMKEALDNLSGINASVDELINMKIPYGETVTRYEKLTAYLNRANAIHSRISRNMDAMTKKKS